MKEYFKCRGLFSELNDFIEGFEIRRRKATSGEFKVSAVDLEQDIITRAKDNIGIYSIDCGSVQVIRNDSTCDIRAGNYSQRSETHSFSSALALLDIVKT